MIRARVCASRAMSRRLGLANWSGSMRRMPHYRILDSMEDRRPPPSPDRAVPVLPALGCRSAGGRRSAAGMLAGITASFPEEPYERRRSPQPIANSLEARPPHHRRRWTLG